VIERPIVPLRLAVLVSGAGTTLRNLIEKIRSGQLTARIDLVISSRPDAGGLAFASQANLESRVLRPRDFASAQQFSEAIFSACREREVQIVAMGGFLHHIPVPPDFENRVTNIHPSLVPAFCGKGLYGLRVHQAVIDYGAKVSGCTVHFVDNEYDHGPIILQRTVPVYDDDTPESLAARVFEQECEAYPTALQQIAEDRLTVTGRKVRTV
jgi:phosphoribosylglycinamide formyltransferase-1